MKAIRFIISLLIGMFIFTPFAYLFVREIYIMTESNNILLSIIYVAIYYYSYVFYRSVTKKFKTWFNSKLK